jgi:hypothetical protein
MGHSTDRAALQQRLAGIEAKVKGVLRQIGGQREVIVKLESAHRSADHARYLLAGLELLEAAYRDSRTKIIADLSKFSD